jgi:hypothetical protein
MSRRAYAGFLLLTLGWLGWARVGYRDLGSGGLTLSEAVVWWGLVVMIVATGYYAIQEAPAARVRPWLRRDFLINVVTLVALLVATLDAAAGFPRMGVRGVGGIALAAAALHPLAVDWPHLRRHRDDPASSPVPQFVPPPCIWIDWTLAALIVIALVRG